MPQPVLSGSIKQETSIVQQVEPPKEIRYTIKEGDNLTKIAEANGISWQRLWEKNTELKHQDQLDIGQIITIPAPDEVLEARPPIASVFTQSPTQRLSGPSRNSSGNTYDWGYCTWYVKNRRPDLPNGLGNANTWYYRAQSFGLSVGSKARVGAVATTTAGSLGHVAYVEAVHGDGTITISEMNYKGVGIQSSRKASETSFFYIY